MCVSCQTRRFRADGLKLGSRGAGIGRARDDGCDGLGSQGVRAQTEERGKRAGQMLVSRRWRCRGGCLDLLAGDGSLQTKLELGLCGAEERLVDLGLVGVQGDIGCSRV